MHFADPVDRAQKTTEQAIAASIQAVRNKSKTRELHPIGACHFCSEPLEGKQLFCDDDCRDDYAKLKRNA